MAEYLHVRQDAFKNMKQWYRAVYVHAGNMECIPPPPHGAAESLVSEE